MRIERVKADVAQSIRSTENSVHACDGVWDVCHLGAFSRDELVGSVSAYGLGPGHVPTGKHWLVHGPFGSEGAALMQALLGSAPTGTVVWAPNHRPLLTYSDGIYAAASTAAPRPRPAVSESGYSFAGIVVNPNVLASVRNRPEMFIGSAHDRVLRELIGGVIAASVEGRRDSTVKEIRVDVTDDGVVSVWDDGPGAPVVQARVAVVEEIMGRAIRWPMAHDQPFIGGHVAIANALSSFCEVETGWEGRRYVQAWRQSVPLMRATDVGCVGREYFGIRFRPDYERFGVQPPTLAEVKSMVEERVWLNPGLVMVFNRQTLVAHQGVVDAARALGGAEAKGVGFHHSAADGFEIRVAVALGQSDHARIFVNQRRVALPPASGRALAGALDRARGDAGCALVVDAVCRHAEVSRDGAAVLLGPSALLDALVSAVGHAVESAGA